ncbi:hypothetical protein RhiirA5_374900 [Rhizophagus irregularis]|uniref:Uncharacterized protein n=2 Tax=Rhizophagus irregularis TaxID=588596 RepID=A0A2I1ESD4_9GLOM|nr:hypothetical protein RhiirA5_374900 [Rhizophagus irregularis]PKY25037.1 hypothetical protein RhiirB3_509912 [Rhizophagus irregularis]
MDYKLYETLNRLPGLFAIAATMFFGIIIIVIFIVRIFQFPHLRQKYWQHDNTQSIPTRILKTIIFLLLAAGLIGVVSYNVYKMKNDPPKFLVTVERSKELPSILICQSDDITFNTVRYYNSFNSFVNYPKQNFDLSGDFKLFQRESDGNCTFFNSTMTMDNPGGFYLLGFSKVLLELFNGMSGSASIISIYIGDTNNEMNWNLLMPQGNKFSDVGFLLASSSGIFQYTETWHKALNGINYRGFQITTIGNFLFDLVSVDDNPMQSSTWIGLIAPTNVIAQVENPSLTLADLLSNVGGYLSIWAIFGFLFGVKKANPFGFVSDFIFINQDKAKLRKELDKMKNDRISKLSNLEKGEEDNAIETNSLSNQSTELRNLLAKYYVDMDFYEHAVKTPDV